MRSSDLPEGLTAAHVFDESARDLAVIGVVELDGVVGSWEKADEPA